MKNQRSLSQLYRSITGTTIARIPAISDSTRDLSRKLGYFPDMSKKFMR